MKQLIRNIYRTVIPGKPAANSSPGISVDELRLIEGLDITNCKKPVYVVGTGRCGTHYLQEFMQEDPGIESYHVGAPLEDSFYRYCAWNNIQIDLEPFFLARKRVIWKAAQADRVPFESNPYLDWSVTELYRKFEAKFIFLIEKNSSELAPGLPHLVFCI